MKKRDSILSRTKQDLELETDTIRQKLTDIRFILWFNTKYPTPVSRWSYAAKYFLAKHLGF